MKRRALLPLFAAALSFGLASCNSGGNGDGKSAFQSPKDAEADFEKIVAIAEEVFWRATDATMKENMGMKGQMTSWERFDAEHEAKSMSVKAAGSVARLG